MWELEQPKNVIALEFKRALVTSAVGQHIPAQN